MTQSSQLNVNKLVVVILATVIVVVSGVTGVQYTEILDTAERLNDLTAMLEQQAGSTLSAMRKPYSYLVSYSTNNGVPTSSACLQSGINGSLVAYGNASYIGALAMNKTAEVKGSVYFTTGNWSDLSITIPDGVSVFVDPGAINLSYSIDDGANASVVDYRDGTVISYENGVMVGASKIAPEPVRGWYLITKSGSQYVGQYPNGSLVTNSTDFATVHNTIDALSTEHMVIEWRFDTAAVSTDLTVHRTHHIYGRGCYLTTLTVTADLTSVLTVSTGDTAYNCVIKGFNIDMNGKTGHGIYANHAGTEASTGIYIVDDTRISGTLYGYDSYYVKDMMFANWGTNYARTYGEGFVIECDETSSFNWGNSHWQRIQVRCLGSNAVGLRIDAESPMADQAANLFKIGSVWMEGVTSATTNTTGIWLDNTQFVNIEAISIEQMNTAVYLYYARCCEFGVLYIFSTQTGSVGFSLQGASGGILARNGWYQTDGMEWDSDATWANSTMLSPTFKSPTLDLSLTTITPYYNSV